MSLDTIDGPPRDHVPVEPPTHPLRNAAVAGAVALAVCAALYYAPATTIAFAAGVVAALWFTTPAHANDRA